MTLEEEIESMQEVCKIITKRYKEKDLKNQGWQHIQEAKLQTMLKLAMKMKKQWALRTDKVRCREDTNWYGNLTQKKLVICWIAAKKILLYHKH